MSINPQRETARLNSTLDKIKELEPKLQKVSETIKTLTATYTSLREEQAALFAKSQAMKDGREAALARISLADGGEVLPDGYTPEERENDEAQVKAADEALAGYEKQLLDLHEALTSEKNKIGEEYTNRQSEHSTLDYQLSALLVKKVQQQQALERAEKSYPALLKRHLRKCRKYGWTDNRLQAAKK